MPSFSQVTVAAFMLAQPLTVVADDTDDVRMLISGHIESWRNGDSEAVAEHYLRDSYTGFGINNNLLDENFSTRHVEELFEAGLEINLEERAINVNLISDNVALITGYLVGYVQNSDQEPIQGTWRFSSVRIKNDNPNDEVSWKIVHLHYSELLP